jgi:hypothetical protein
LKLKGDKKWNKNQRYTVAQTENTLTLNAVKPKKYARPGAK